MGQQTTTHATNNAGEHWFQLQQWREFFGDTQNVPTTTTTTMNTLRNDQESNDTNYDRYTSQKHLIQHQRSQNAAVKGYKAARTCRRRRDSAEKHDAENSELTGDTNYYLHRTKRQLNLSPATAHSTNHHRKCWSPPQNNKLHQKKPTQNDRETRRFQLFLFVYFYFFT